MSEPHRHNGESVLGCPTCDPTGALIEERLAARRHHRREQAMSEELRAALNPEHQQLLDEKDHSGTTWRCGCGAPLFSEDECAECHGDDLFGEVFCPVEQFCCGC